MEESTDDEVEVAKVVKDGKEALLVAISETSGGRGENVGAGRAAI